MSETWLDNIAVRRHGPESKHGYPSVPSRAVLEIEGICAHSMEGPLMAALGELDRLDRRASWTFSNPKTGKLLQHYPLEAITWASGSVEANRLFVAVESEGVAGELLNANQRQNMVALMGELGRLTGLVWARPTTLVEHKEMTVYGSSPTACPSGRYPWAQILALAEEEDMPLTPDDIEKIKVAVWSQLEQALDQEFYDAVATRIAQMPQWQQILDAASGTGPRTVKLEGTLE